MFAPPENCGPSSFATIVFAPKESGLLFFPAWLGHFDRVQRALEFFLGQNFFLPCNFAHCASGLRTLFCNLRGAIITDLRRETGYHCHGKLYQLAAALFVRYDAAHTFLAEN